MRLLSELKKAATLLVSVIMLNACTKNPDVPQPPSPVDSTTYAMFTVSGVQLTGTRLYAVVSINNTSGQPVLQSKKVTLDYINGVYITDKIALPRGNYYLTKLLVLYASDTAAYAAPIALSAKAGGVNNPLPMAIGIQQTGINAFSAGVLKIMAGESAAAYGYADSDFGNLAFIDLKVKLSIQVGAAMYEGIPGKLIIHATNAQGTQWTRELDMQQGETPVRVPDGFIQYSISVVKWNEQVQQQFSRANLQAGMLIGFTAIGVFKKLKEEKVYSESVTGLVPESRTVYQYNNSGKLSFITFYQRSTTTPGLAHVFNHQFQYRNNVLDSIVRTDANNTLTGYTTFTYTAGRITTAKNKSYDQETIASFEKHLNGNGYLLFGQYHFYNGNSMSYNQVYEFGNKVSDIAQSSLGGSELGQYTYDSNINPYYLMDYPDMYMSNGSKNNLLSQQKSYSGSIPSSVPYKYEYIYDEDGYPVTLYTSFKGYTSNTHLFRLKKEFIYQ